MSYDDYNDEDDLEEKTRRKKNREFKNKKKKHRMKASERGDKLERKVFRPKFIWDEDEEYEEWQDWE